MLADLDARLVRLPLFALRFMDDVLVLAKTRWKLREAVRVAKATLDELRLAKHPDTTFIGRVERGFDFLGFHFTPQGVSVAPAEVAMVLRPSAPAVRAVAGGSPKAPPCWVRAGQVSLRLGWQIINA